MKQDIHDPHYVSQVFDRCAGSYRAWSAIGSFGFVRRWRNQCVKGLSLDRSSAPLIMDLMAGTGEIWPHTQRQFPKLDSILAVDISKEMHRHALEKLHRGRDERIQHLQANVLSHPFDEARADGVISSFGLKTLNAEQQEQLASQIHKVLKPGGRFSLVEATDPKGWILRPLYRFYLDKVLPLIEKIALKGAQDFSHLGLYTKTFENGDLMEAALQKVGFEEVIHRRLFFGTAVLLTGKKGESH